MGESQSSEFQSGQIMEKLASLEKSRTEQMGSITKSIESLDHKIDNFTHGIGERVENHGGRISVMEANLKLLNAVAWLLFASSLGTVCLAFFKLVLK